MARRPSGQVRTQSADTAPAALREAAGHADTTANLGNMGAT